MSTALLANLGRVQDHKDVLGCDVVQRHHHKAEDPVQAEQGKQDDAGPRDFPGSKEARILAGYKFESHSSARAQCIRSTMLTSIDMLITSEYLNRRHRHPHRHSLLQW